MQSNGKESIELKLETVHIRTQTHYRGTWVYSGMVGISRKAVLL